MAPWRHVAPFLKRVIIRRHYHARSAFTAFTKQAWLSTPEKKPLSYPLKAPSSSQGPPPAFSRPLSQSAENRPHICSLQYLQNKGVGKGSGGTEVNTAYTKFLEDPGQTKSPASAGDHVGRLGSSR